MLENLVIFKKMWLSILLQKCKKTFLEKYLISLIKSYNFILSFSSFCVCVKQNIKQMPLFTVRLVIYYCSDLLYLISESLAKIYFQFISMGDIKVKIQISFGADNYH